MAQRKAFFPALFGGEEVITNLRQILGHSVKLSGLGIPDPWLSVEHADNTFKSASEVLVDLLLGGTDLNYVVHKGCVRRASTEERNQHNFPETAALTRRKELAEEAGLNYRHRAT